MSNEVSNERSNEWVWSHHEWWIYRWQERRRSWGKLLEASRYARVKDYYLFLCMQGWSSFQDYYLFLWNTLPCWCGFPGSARTRWKREREEGWRWTIMASRWGELSVTPTPNSLSIRLFWGVHHRDMCRSKSCQETVRFHFSCIDDFVHKIH